MSRKAQLHGGLFDVAILGAGVIGCATARRFALEGARVVLIDKAADLLDGASKANSAILHTGFDAPRGTLEQACVARGHAEYLEIRERLNLPLLETGALVLAWTEAEEDALPQLMTQARANGVGDIEPMGGAALRRLEPELADHVRAGFRVPREYVIDPWSAPYAFALQAVENGATLLRGAQVQSGTFDGTGWELSTPVGNVRAQTVINAGGLYGDVIDRMLLGQTDFEIRPRKGQFVVFDKPASQLVRHILLPVPSATTKGVVVCRTIFGNLLVGPTAEEQTARDVAELVPETLQALRQRGAEILPRLAQVEVTAIYAGLRPASQFKDYRIKRHEGRNFITIGAIRSTGLTASLGIARHVFDLYAESLDAPPPPLPDPVWPSVPNIAEHRERAWQRAQNGGIVCHCERVARCEIEAALNGPIPVQSAGGLKRRTRAMLGRCQGFYCMAELEKITRGRMVEPLTGPAP